MLENGVSRSDAASLRENCEHWVELEYGVIVAGCECFEDSLGTHIEEGQTLLFDPDKDFGRRTVLYGDA